MQIECLNVKTSLGSSQTPHTPHGKLLILQPMCSSLVLNNLLLRAVSTITTGKLRQILHLKNWVTACTETDLSHLESRTTALKVKERLRTVFFYVLKSVNLRKRTALLLLGMKPPKNVTPKKLSRQKIKRSNVKM